MKKKSLRGKLSLLVTAFILMNADDNIKINLNGNYLV